MLADFEHGAKAASILLPFGPHETNDTTTADSDFWPASMGITSWLGIGLQLTLFIVLVTMNWLEGRRWRTHLTVVGEREANRAVLALTVIITDRLLELEATLNVSD